MTGKGEMTAVVSRIHLQAEPKEETSTAVWSVTSCSHYKSRRFGAGKKRCEAEKKREQRRRDEYAEQGRQIGVPKHEKNKGGGSEIGKKKGRRRDYCYGGRCCYCCVARLLGEEN